jgi:tetratricopeptide (TPR) repeat protein
LRDASLLRTVRPGRFTLFESVRELASEQLEARGERLEACRQHAAFTVERCAQLALAVEERGEPLERLLEERWNLEQALRWSIASGEREQAVRAVLALAPMLTSQGPLRYLLDALGQALSVAPSDARLLHARGRVLQTLGRLAEAERDLRAGLDLASTALLRARVCKDLGVLEHQRREVAAAARWYQEALDLAVEAGDRRLRAICTGNMGALRHDVRDYAAAEERYEEALATLRACGDTRTEGVFLTNLAVLNQENERFERARSGYKRAIDILRNVGDRRAEGVAFENLAVLEHLDGNLEESREHHERALELLEGVGDERSEALCRARLGAVLAQLGQCDAGAAQLERSAALLADRDDPIASGVRDVYRGFVDLAEGDRVTAIKRLRAARLAPKTASVEDGPPLVAVSDDARAAASVLEAWLAKSSRLRLSIGPGGLWFQVADGESQSLQARPTHARLLACLADLHALAPEKRLDVTALFEVGWPGQAASHESSQNRVHVALAQLRKLGLSAVLEHVEAGYRLNPEWLVVRKRNGHH